MRLASSIKKHLRPRTPGHEKSAPAASRRSEDPVFFNQICHAILPLC